MDRSFLSGPSAPGWRRFQRSLTPHGRPWALAGSAGLFLLSGLACTSSDIYAVDGLLENPPDRLVIRGEVCTEDPASGSFPAKVLFIMEQSEVISDFDPEGRRLGIGGSSALSNVEQVVRAHKRLAHVSFGFVGVAGFARALPLGRGQIFYRGTEPEADAARANFAVTGTNRRNVVDALIQMRNFILSDIANSSAGEVVRSRYIVSMLFAGPPESTGLTPIEFGQRVEAIREQVFAKGVLEFQINVGLLYTGELSTRADNGGYSCFLPDPSASVCACGGASGAADFCSVHCALATGTAIGFNTALDRSREVYGAIAFAGGGLFSEFPCPTLIDLNIDVGRSEIELVRKDILAFNRNAQLSPDGYLVDSDGDGLPDIHELAAVPPTDPLNFDSDGDGLNDRVEVEAQKDPLNPNDRPGSCLDPAVLGGVLPDRDFDRLNDCEEGLLQAKASVPDTDGDGLPDYIEFRNSMLPSNAIDRLLDFDLDGVINAQEALEHTDPYSNEGLSRGAEAYRNTIVPLGLKRVSTINNSNELRGIVFRRASPELQPGQSFMQWDGCSQNLSWSDAGFFGGGRRFVPEVINVPSPGIYRTQAFAANGDLIWAEWLIDPRQMPSCSSGTIDSFPLISSAKRNCYDVTISNIKLVETQGALRDSPLEADRTRPGTNSILVFFTQAPATRLGSPGVGRVAEVEVHFECTDPDVLSSCLRLPRSGEIALPASL